ncbi:VanZ family protein [Rathayibacter sp. VKM Ac-2630]|uniref:VanZ family protein n=1 Tax=Rathayibacter sp. VKM Ac-2630 TaxID=1938617 RepID=UPI00098258ED|nr:VanZ family protein [Rathayibacter sp. VKM Ac-2630]OOB90059.1 hypothetical protein B0T42_13860 [Rathayibacter sp. VKM Ac-2630]
MSRSLTRLTLAVGAPYLAALALVAFWPVPVDSGVRRLLDRLLAALARHGLGVIDYDLIERAANVALFVPLGVLLALHLRARWAWLAVVVGATTSAVIETGQLLFLSDRFATTDDVVMNTLGAAIGTVLGAVVRAVLQHRERLARREDDLLVRAPVAGRA